MKRHTAEQIIPKLRQAEADLAQGLGPAQVCQRLGVSEQTLHRWRNQYGGMKADEAKRLKELEAENARLKRLVAELAGSWGSRAPPRGRHPRRTRRKAGWWRGCWSWYGSTHATATGGSGRCC